MRIQKIELKNVKSFDGVIATNFAPLTSMFAFSGMNGAGKSTFLKVAWLVQKAHFVSSSGDAALATEVGTEIKRFLNNNDSYAAVTLLDHSGIPGKKEAVASVTITLRLTDEGAGFKLEYSDLATADRIWNVKDPRNLILYVDASKGFSEETLRFDEINILGNERQALALEAIFNPEKLFSGIYRQLIKDYVHSRLIPSTPDRLLYYHVASKLFTKLIPRVELKNFSGNYKPGEFVLLGKANSDKYKPLYDVREFSSGEKALLSTLTFLCISKSVSTLIIDEPENHFHESLLLEFMSVLHKLCEQDGIFNWISEAGTAGKKINLDWIASEYKGHNLNQVVVSTHSKPLIYKFFSIGKNFIINKNIAEITYESAEASLREIGLSTTFTKVLFVEGEGDNEALEDLVRSKNIRIKALKGCSAVIDTFKRIAAIRAYVQDSRFVFLVDSDNKTPKFFEEVRAIDPGFYDSYFITLDAHEFENLYLDPFIFKTVIERYEEISGSKSTGFSIQAIENELVRIATESLPHVYKKELSLAFSQAIERHFSAQIWGNKSFKWNDTSSVGIQLLIALSKENCKDLGDSLMLVSTKVFDMYDNIDTLTLLKRCDGKQVLNKAATFFGQKLGVQGATFKKALYSAATNLASSKAAQLSANIVERFNTNL